MPEYISKGGKWVPKSQDGVVSKSSAIEVKVELPTPVATSGKAATKKKKSKKGE